MDKISVKNIGKSVNYITDGKNNKTKEGILLKIYKRSLYGHVTYDIKAKNGKILYKNDLEVWV